VLLAHVEAALDGRIELITNVAVQASEDHRQKGLESARQAACHPADGAPRDVRPAREGTATTPG
jgi:hypothetical protein